MMNKDNSSLPSLVYVLALAQFAAPFMFSGVGIALPAMGKDLQASGIGLGLIESIYLGAASAFLLPMGRLADLTDKNSIFKAGIFTYALSTLILGFLSSLPAIIAFRFIQGLSASLIMATNMAILTNIVPKNILGKAIGLNIGAVYTGLSAGPFVAGWITTNYGWRAVFHVAFVPLILSYLLIEISLKSKWKFPQVHFDVKGTVLIVTSIFLLIFGSALMGDSYLGFILCAAGLIMGALFFIIEKGIAEPLLNSTELRENLSLSMALLIQLFMYAGAFGTTFLMSIYLQSVKGFSSQAAGQILVVSPVIMAFFAPICGRLADAFPPRKLASTGLACNLVSALLACRISSATGIHYVMAVLVFQGLGFAMFSSPNMAIIMNSVSPKEYGFASAMAAEMRSLGMVVAMMIITLFLSLYIGKQMIDTHPAKYLSVMHSSFIIFAFFATAGIYLSFKKYDRPGDRNLE